MSTPNVFVAYLARKLEAAGSETTIYLDRLTTKTGETISTSDFTTYGRGILTINPDGDGESSYPEYCSFTAVDSSAVSVTGVTRGLSAKSNSVVSANKRFHPVGTPVVISFGAHNLLDLKDYTDDADAALAVGTSNAVTGVAGETISTAPALVYLKNDGKWWLTDADTAATVENVQLGLALSAVAADASITNGVVRNGLVSGFTGLVAGTTYYASNTAGEVSSSAGTTSLRVGVAKSDTELYFDPVYYELPTGDEKAALAGTSGTPSGSNKFVTANDVAADGTTDKIIRANGTDLPSGITAVSRKISTGSVANITDSTTETNLVSVSIPANTLGTSNAIRFKVWGHLYDADGSVTATIRTKYGSTTLATAAISSTQTTASDDALIVIDGVLMANASASAQKCFVNVVENKGNTIDMAYGTATEDSSGALNLVISMQLDNVLNSDFSGLGYVIEKLQ